jgi:hypothetical protein
MSIFARPGDPFVATLTDAPSGLVGTLTIRVKRSDGTTAIAATTSGIIENEPGIYTAVGTAPDVAGTYLVIWDDDGTLIEEDFRVSLIYPEAGIDPIEVEWRPSLGEVAALLRTRTKVNAQAGGGEAGTFTDDTRPTGDQAETLINIATSYAASRVGTTEALCPDSERTEALTSRARGLAAVYAAMLIELSYFPEQINKEISPYKELKKLWDEGIESLVSAVEKTCGADLPGGESSGSRMPSYNFDKSIVDLGMEKSW